MQAAAQKALDQLQRWPGLAATTGTVASPPATRVHGISSAAAPWPSTGTKGQASARSPWASPNCHLGACARH